MKKLLGSAALAALLAFGSSVPATVNAEAVVKSYADIAQPGYEGSLSTDVAALLPSPSAMK